MKLVSVIIPTYNRYKDLQLLLNSIAASDYPEIEIIVVDNASTDDTGRIAAEFMEENCREQGQVLSAHAASDSSNTNPHGQHAGSLTMQYIASPVNLNAGGGRAEGVKHAKGEYLLFVDDDNEIYPDMITELVRFMELHPGTGLAAPLSLGGDDGKEVGALGCGIDLKTSRAVFVQSGVRVEQVDPNGVYPTTAATNSFMMTREAYEKSGGWDPYFEIMYEETDLGLRVQKAGFEQYYAPKARTLHLGAVATGENVGLRSLGIGSPRRAYTFARNRSIMMRRHAGLGARIVYFAVYNPAFTAYYVMQALKYHRADIALGYWKGAWKGCFCAKFGDHSPVL